MRTQLLQLPISYAKTTIFVVLALLFLATVGGKNLYFRGDYNIFFDGTNPQLEAFEEIQATFNKTDNLAIVISPPTGEIFSETYLTMLRQFTEDAWQIPYSSRVDSIANYQHTEAFEDDLLVEDLLLEDYPLDEPRINKVQGISVSEPALLNAVISEKGDVSIVNITVQLPEANKTAEVMEVVTYADTMLDRYRAEYPGIEFHKAGIIAMNYNFMMSAQQDSSTLVPTMLLIILLFLKFMLRSIFAVVATLLVIIGSVAATMGLSGWAGMFLSTGTVNVPTLVLTLAVADCVHVIATMRQSMQHGKSKFEAIKHSIQLNFVPIWVTSVTTAIGFLMMNASDSPILRDFGNLSALGVIIACILSVTLLPALLMVLPIRIKQKTEEEHFGYMDKLGDRVVRYRKTLLPASILVLVGAGSMLPLNVVNDESVKYFGKGNEFREAADFMESHISGMTNISIAIESGESQGVADPAFLKTLEDFTQWLRAQPETDHVASLADVFKRLNKNMHGDDDSYYRLPQDRELAAQYLLLYEMSLPYGLDLNNQINIDKSAVRLVLTTDNLGSKQLVELENRIHAWFNENAPAYSIKASSPALMFAHIGETNMASMLKSLPITLLLISALMIFALRSLRLGIISVVPNMAPAIIGFGMWGLLSGEINLGLSVVVTLTLGIVVDDSVHFLSKYRYARLQGKNAEDSVRYAFHTVARAFG